MKAMVLAAGMGTRLRPMTDNKPKALVEIHGRTLLEITLRRLQEFGIRDVIVNVHHFADMVVDYLKTNNNFGMHIDISREEVLLDTGGGLKQAAWFFAENDDFILHNADVISTIALDLMVKTHQASGALATIAVSDRPSSRRLLFDSDLQLRGREGDAAAMHPLAFNGIHVISPRIFPVMSEQGVFSIITPYLRLAAAGERIRGFRTDESRWLDLGKLENVRRANSESPTFSGGTDRP